VVMAVCNRSDRLLFLCVESLTNASSLWLRAPTRPKLGSRSSLSRVLVCVNFMLSFCPANMQAESVYSNEIAQEIYTHHAAFLISLSVAPTPLAHLPSPFFSLPPVPFFLFFSFSSDSSLIFLFPSPASPRATAFA